MPKIQTVKHRLANNRVLKHLVPRRSLKNVHQYWKSQNLGDENAYTDYLKNIQGSEAFFHVVSKHLSEKDVKVLEIGCNAGRNLDVFFRHGYHDLSGIEINSNAIDVMKTYYPDLARNIKIYNKTVEEKIKDFIDGEFDLVFTVGVLMHIHPDSEWVFSEIVRIAKRFVVMLEDETGVATKNFPRNYKKIFEGLGMEEVEFINELAHWRPIYKVRVFRKKRD